MVEPGPLVDDPFYLGAVRDFMQMDGLLLETDRQSRSLKILPGSRPRPFIDIPALGEAVIQLAPVECLPLDAFLSVKPRFEPD